MISNATTILLYIPILIQLNIKLSTSIELVPLHPHPNTLNHNDNRRVVETSSSNSDEFKNSAVYNTIKLLRNSGDRGERLLTYYKQARFEQHEERRRDREVSSRLGQPNAIPYLKERNTKAITFPLFQGLGSHYCTAHVGTPPQVTTLLVDTGSEMTGFPCVGCVGCGEHTDPYFDPDKSSTFEVVNCDECAGYGTKCSIMNNRCRVAVSYLEGSEWKGYQARDVFSLTIDDAQTDIQNELQVPFTFACETIESGLFESQLENGIMGLMNSNITHLPNVLNKEHKIPINSFSLCMGLELITSKTNSVHSGIMTLGGFDNSHHTTPMVYVKNTNSFGYNAAIRKIYLQKKDKGDILPIIANYQNIGDALIDSGTTLTYLNTEYSAGFNQVWKNITGQEYTTDKLEISKKQLAELPTILIQLEGVDNNCNDDIIGLAGSLSLDESNCQDVILKIPPSHYMFYYGDDIYSCEFHFENQYRLGGIIGGNSMQGHDVFFDNENNRIGFAESNCDYGDAVSKDKKP